MGLMIIMVAHASPPGWLFQLRNFGTPLLVVGSALTYAYIYKHRAIEPLQFYKKRLKALIIPPWIFLSLFFALYLIIAQFENIDFPFQGRQILESYLFLEGIGFVWIFKIYIILALLTPITVWINNRKSNHIQLILTIIIFYISYEILVAYLKLTLNTDTFKLISTTLLVLIPYGLLYAYAFTIRELNSKKLATIASAFLMIFLALAAYKFDKENGFVQTQSAKYPPTIYYLSYALFAIHTIYLIIRNIKISQAQIRSSIIWLSSNSLWIYLWHIMAFYTWQSFEPPFNSYVNFLMKVIYLFGFGITMTLVQNKISHKISNRSIIFKNMIAPYVSSAKK
jgi:hypothetical protein